MPKNDKRSLLVVSENLFPVVGVGASAGGIEAFKELLQAIPKDSGMAYILIQHLAPNHESILTEILQKSTKVPVVEITDNIKVLPDHIYIIPSNKSLTANDGKLQLDPLVKGEKLNTIDVFFTSLSEIHQEHAIGVVLSGTGSDGTVGLKTIKDMGGITIAQDEQSAAYYGMPQSAIAADVVDFILPPREIPLHLKKLTSNLQIVSSGINLEEEIKGDEVFKKILSLLQAKRGVDFSFYKQTTIRRRILRRKALNKMETLTEYLQFLRENKTEQEALFNDILIPVTAFFRDPKTFTLLCEKVFPNLVKGKAPTDTIRIWVAGCSTGEEAYSIAICLHEYFNELVLLNKIQIFATDISPVLIAKARSGVYQKKDLAGVSEARLEQFFTKIDGSYQVNKAIRQMCVFACHNFLKDPPFARIDLISCRNVLIYLESFLQKKAFTLFHYALNSPGFLLLGKSESIIYASEQFGPLSQQGKIYQRKGTAGKFMGVATKRSEQALKKEDNNETYFETKKDDYQKASTDALLARYVPVGVIINEQLDIIQFRGSTGAYLEAPPGRANHNILKMAREGLAFELRNALHKAKLTGNSVRKEGISFDKGKSKADIEVIPLQNTIETYFLVLFDQTRIPEKIKTKKYKGTTGNDSTSATLLGQIEQLEKELSQAREDMRGITEDQEAINEELQSANEELLSGSEELQTLNEELETGREEIQSTNEELTIQNQELIDRNEQLIHSRKYAEAIIATVHEPLLILTKNLNIKNANRCFYETFETTEQQTENKSFFEWGDGIWNVPGLHEKLDKILPQHSYFNGIEIRIASAYVDEKIFLLNARQIINEASNEKLILLAMQDITERKNLEAERDKFEHELEYKVLDRTKELNEANINLKHSNENLQQFASIASHDLQEPLRKVKTFTSILATKFGEKIPDEGKEVVAKIRSSVERMSHLIKEVLEYSKVANSKKEFQQTNLHDILKNVLNDLELVISETGAEISYNEALPVAEAIPLQINQLFYNLLVNALKFHIVPGVPVVSISFRILTSDEAKKFENLNAENSYLEIKITDNGIGFEQQFGEQIFQLFERLHAEEDFPGTGVGLALCKKIVENHHGHIFALSKEDEGAEFYIILPLEQTTGKLKM